MKRNLAAISLAQFTRQTSLVLLVTFLFTGPGKCYSAGEVATAFERCAIQSEDVEGVYRAVFDIHRLGMVAIPCLIRHIDTPKKIYLGLADPSISTLLPIDTTPQYIGVLYAYLIDLIIRRATLLGNSGQEIHYVLGNTPGNYIHRHGVIVRKDGKALTMKDMESIKKLYEEWWKKNENMPTELLRNDLAKGGGPLSATVYLWR